MQRYYNWSADGAPHAYVLVANCRGCVKPRMGRVKPMQYIHPQCMSISAAVEWGVHKCAAILHFITKLLGLVIAFYVNSLTYYLHYVITTWWLSVDY